MINCKLCDFYPKSHECEVAELEVKFRYDSGNSNLNIALFLDFVKKYCSILNLKII